MLSYTLVVEVFGERRGLKDHRRVCTIHGGWLDGSVQVEGFWIEGNSNEERQL
jgi:hypothetical protein